MDGVICAFRNRGGADLDVFFLPVPNDCALIFSFADGGSFLLESDLFLSASIRRGAALAVFALDSDHADDLIVSKSRSDGRMAAISVFDVGHVLRVSQLYRMGAELMVQSAGNRFFDFFSPMQPPVDKITSAIGSLFLRLFDIMTTVKNPRVYGGLVWYNGNKEN